MQMAAIVLDYLRVLLSPAPVGGLAVLVLFLVFRAEVRALIGRIATIKFPGGELSTTQLERSRQVGDITPSPAPPQTPPDPANLPPQLNLTADQQQRLTEFIQAEGARAALWEYRYLNYYLVPHTQLVLEWLASLGQRTTYELFDTFWMPLIPNPNERGAIISALCAHHLVNLQGNLLEVTPKGREYIKWRGPLPAPLPSPPLQPTNSAVAAGPTSAHGSAPGG